MTVESVLNESHRAVRRSAALLSDLVFRYVSDLRAVDPHTQASMPILSDPSTGEIWVLFKSLEAYQDSGIYAHQAWSRLKKASTLTWKHDLMYSGESWVAAYFVLDEADNTIPPSLSKPKPSVPRKIDYSIKDPLDEDIQMMVAKVANYLRIIRRSHGFGTAVDWDTGDLYILFDSKDAYDDSNIYSGTLWQDMLKNSISAVAIPNYKRVGKTFYAIHFRFDFSNNNLMQPTTPTKPSVPRKIDYSIKDPLDEARVKKTMADLGGPVPYYIYMLRKITPRGTKFKKMESQGRFWVTLPISYAGQPSQWCMMQPIWKELEKVADVEWTQNSETFTAHVKLKDSGWLPLAGTPSLPTSKPSIPRKIDYSGTDPLDEGIILRHRGAEHHDEWREVHSPR